MDNSRVFFENEDIKLYCGDSRQMSELADGSVQMVVTSPPYWGLRAYKAPLLVWGGKANCQHRWGHAMLAPYYDKRDKATKIAHGAQVGSSKTTLEHTTPYRGQYCQDCGAWLGAFGLEPSPEMYVDHTLVFLREIRRVLRKDGVVFWNIADSYCSGHRKTSIPQTLLGADDEAHTLDYTPSRDLTHPYIKDKDLCLIPERLAIAVQADGWWLRQVIIWAKANPLPESVQDRPTRAYEFILMLTKSPRYFWNAISAREPFELTTHPKRSISLGVPIGRNLRNIWYFSVEQSRFGKHHAVFPRALPEICIRIATPQANCKLCGTPWQPIAKRGYKPTRPGLKVSPCPNDEPHHQLHSDLTSKYRMEIITTLTDWRQACSCPTNDTTPPLVLDPFVGTGTTLVVAQQLGRRAVGYDISAEYCEIARQRLIEARQLCLN